MFEILWCAKASNLFHREGEIECVITMQKTPNLAVETLNHGRFSLAIEDGARGTVVCFIVVCIARFVPLIWASLKN